MNTEDGRPGGLATMTIVEIAVLLVAVAFAVLVGYLVPVLMQVRKTVAESEQLLSKMNAEVPGLSGGTSVHEPELERCDEPGA